LPEVGAYNGKVLRVGTSGQRDPQPVRRCIVLDPIPGATLDVRHLTPGEALPSVLRHARHPLAFATPRRALQLHVVAGLSRGSCIRLTFDPAHHAPDALASHIDRLIEG
jgi:hypothetical protein